MKQNIRTLAAIMICGITLAACSDKDNDDNSNIVNNPDPATVETVRKPSLPQSCTLTITATKGNDASLSKALSLTNEDKTLTASWATGEKVAVYNGDTKIGELTAQSDGETTTLSGSNLTPAPSASDVLTLKFNETDYSGQDGTLETIASKYDYATATVTVASVSADGNITIEETAADFKNQQAIVKFTLKSGENNVKATSLQINSYTITPKEPTNVFFVAICLGENAEKISLKANTESEASYIFSKEDVKFASGKYYEVTVANMTKEIDLSKLTDEGSIEVQDNTILTGTLGGNYQILIADGATVTLKDVTIDIDYDGEDGNQTGIACNGDATIILEGENNIVGGADRSAISGQENKTLTIDGEGKLSANTYDRGIATISGSNIIINGGTITATAVYAPGIGSGYYNTHCDNITINGGKVTAIGIGDNAPGIGSVDGVCYAISINGGTVTATGGGDAPGIGSGPDGECDYIYIYGGTVTATGGDNAPGIGSGDDGYCNNIYIYSDVEKVTATKGNGYDKSISADNVEIEEGANVTQN